MAAIQEQASRALSQLQDLADSSDDEEDGETRMKLQLLEKACGVYYTDLQSKKELAELPGVQQFLSGTLLTASSSCLVCLSSIKRTDAVWSCKQCYCVFHLQCIQQWVVDGVQQQSLLSPDLFPGLEQLWSCPKCRYEYPRSQCPQKYMCFCGKMVRYCMPMGM